MPAETIEALGYGVGLLHSLSGTCAFDIDDMTAARAWWAERGVDVDELLKAPDSVHISSGRAGRDKLLYRLTKPMRTVKPTGCGFELRSATASGDSVQDVLPPSIHPITKKPYEWKYGDEILAHWSSLPPIPATVYNVWRELAHSEPVNEVVNERASRAPLDDVRTAVAGWIKSRDIDMDDYDQWIQTGMRIHKETNGDKGGLAIWDEVSRDSPKYKGIADLKVHWVTFDASGRIGLEAALREVPAAPEEFEVIEDKPSEAAAEVKQENKNKLATARAILEDRLVYVAYSERYFDRKDHRLFNTDSAIRHTFTSMMPRRNNAHLDPIKVLQNSGTKLIVDKLGFHPGEGAIFKYRDDTFANNYRNRLPRLLEPTEPELRVIEELFGRIADPVFREYLLGFYSHVVKHPGDKIYSAPLIWSETQGNGKSTLVRAIPALLVGYQYSKEVNSSLLASDFNDYLKDAWHVNLTEFRAGSRGERDAISKKIESWISEPEVAMHPKGQPGYTMPNHFFITASSNADDAAMLSSQDRKWAIHELKAPKMSQSESEWVYGFLKSARASGVLRHYFLNLETTFNPTARAPVTEAKLVMTEASEALDVEALREAFEDRSGPFGHDIVTTSDVRIYLRDVIRQFPSQRRIANLLTKLGGKALRIGTNSRTQRVVVMYNHDRWATAGAAQIFAHLDGDRVSTEDELLQ